MIFNLNRISNIMGAERIVSFFPSATELLYELGVGNKVFGVTHECLYPEDAKSKPRIISSVFDPNTMSSREIDDKIVELIRDGNWDGFLNADFSWQDPITGLSLLPK